MDLQIALVCFGLVVLSAAVLYLLSMFSMQKKTYEEAIAEQRKMPEDSLILGRPSKDKMKDKKQKRQGKKVKEKVKERKESAKTQSSTETDNETVHKDTEHTHVNFSNDKAEVVPEIPVPNVQDDKKKKKKEKIKPILVNKEEHTVIRNPVQPPPQINHFEEILPKDDLELHRIMGKTDLHSTNSESDSSNLNQEFIDKEKIKPVIADKNDESRSQKASRTEKVKLVEQFKLESESVSTSSTSLDQSPVQHAKLPQLGKDQKKKIKKTELSLQQMTDRDGVNIHILKPLIEKAELSRSEVQDLTDLLLNRHSDSELAEHSEWYEGRQDPMVKLKKQLAEKEKSLSEEQEASQALQSKLKELRTELNSERSRLGQACRQYEENIVGKQTEVQGLHARLQHVMESHVAEKTALTQKLQQLQAQVNDDSIMIRKVHEDHGQTHNTLQQEIVNQRQQMEMHISRLNEQHQETENNLKAQIHAQHQELDKLNANLNNEVQTRRRYEDDVKQLKEQHLHSQTMVKTLESRASQLKESTSQSQELARQIEELQRTNKELDKRLSSSHQVEEELKFEKTRLQTEFHAVSGKLGEMQTECDKARKERERMAAQSAAKSELDGEVLRLKEENHCLITQVSSYAKLQVEAQQLREENENLAAQLTAFTERPAAEGRENGDSPYNEDSKHISSVDINNHENEVKKKNSVIEKLEADLKEKHSLMETLSSELNNIKSQFSKQTVEISKFKTDVDRLEREVDAQRSKNNDLRQKNWKAMEALSSTEKSLESKNKQTDQLVNEAVSRARLDEQTSTKALLGRLFPDLKIEEKVYEQWSSKFESSAVSVLNELNRTNQLPSSPAKSDSSDSSSGLEKQNSQLQTVVAHYKKIIDETEGMLNKLQSHIEREEIRWNQLLADKERELEELRGADEENDSSQASMDGVEFAFNCIEKTLPNVINELQDTVKKLEDELAKNVTDKEEGLATLLCIRTENETLKTLADSEAMKRQQISEEKDALSLKLNEESDKIKELNKEIVKLRSNLKIGQDSYDDEHRRRIALEEELRSLSIKNNHQDSQLSSSPNIAVVEDGSEK